jgi:hypothetical protein
MSTSENTQPITMVDGGRKSAGAPDDTSNRVISGVVAADGTISVGSGFSVSKNGTGSYVVTFDSPFSNAPVLSLTPGGTLTPLYTNPFGWNNSSATFTYRDSQGNPTDSWFNFIAIGPA